MLIPAKHGKPDLKLANHCSDWLRVVSLSLLGYVKLTACHADAGISPDATTVMYPFGQYDNIKRILLDSKRRCGWECLVQSSLIPDRTLAVMR